jgi:hypothetical protein
VQSKLDAAERRLVEYEQADEKRQQEFDNILLNLKKQREAEEVSVLIKCIKFMSVPTVADLGFSDGGGCIRPLPSPSP